MKKIFSTICIFALINLTTIPVFCTENAKNVKNAESAKSAESSANVKNTDTTAIQDDFIENTLSKDLKIKPVKSFNIKDDFIEENLDKTLSVKEFQYKNITDDFAQNNKNKNPKRKRIIITETLPKTDRTISSSINKAQIFNIENLTPLLIKPVNTFSTKRKLQEGDQVFFETANAIKINGVYYKKGTRIKARVETVSQNKMWGVPSDLVIGNFSIDNIPLYGEISKTGANRALWLYPAIYATSFLFGASSLFAFIRGGHAKIKTGETYTIYVNTAKNTATETSKFKSDI